MNRHDPHPAMDDLDADVNLVDPGFADLPRPIDPRDFIRPDGSYDVTPINVAHEEQVAAVNEFKRRLRDATPITPDMRNVK